MTYDNRNPNRSRRPTRSGAQNPRFNQPAAAYDPEKPNRFLGLCSRSR